MRVLRERISNQDNVLSSQISEMKDILCSFNTEKERALANKKE